MDMLLHLSVAGRLVLTCRNDVWDSAYKERLPFAVREVEELDSGMVSHLLPDASENKLLRTPFFLDFAIRRREKWGIIPRTDISFLMRLFRDAESEGGALPDSAGPRKRAIIQALAELQLNELNYEITRRAVETRAHLPVQIFQHAVKKLKDERLVLERAPDSLLSDFREPTLRLAHDMLDCFSMARVVYDSEDRHTSAMSVCRRSERECGWSILSMLIRLAHHHRDEDLLRTIFGEFLRILDRKRFNDIYMAQTWAVTYVLREQLPILLPLVIEALRGTPVPNLRPGAEDMAGSRIGKDAQLTQDAASSVASAFLGLENGGDVADAPHVVPVLTEGLAKWELKGRFIDALARYNTREVQTALVDFGNKVLDTREDLPCLRYVARGLNRFEADRSTIMLLERVAQDPEIDPVTRRRAHEVLRRHDGRSVPDRTEREIVYGLAIKANRAARPTGTSCGSTPPSSKTRCLEDVCATFLDLDWKCVMHSSRRSNIKWFMWGRLSLPLSAALMNPWLVCSARPVDQGHPSRGDQGCVPGRAPAANGTKV
ncbi:hypothetical protein ABGB17_02830 [Sphaerisporangium sp. B11E5]|uniref:hypothetical protein n=1 Tax=Sphaerisporangium sp. B11E5 TaxID=3153563 RepID=UPI00325E6F7F